MNATILVLLSLVHDFKVYRQNFKPYSAIYNFSDNYSKSSIRVAVSHLLEGGDIEKIILNGTAHFSLTTQGFRIVASRFLRQYNATHSHWDGKWRIIIFDIPEKQRKKRAKVRKILAKLSFGRASNSIYISPFDNLKLAQDEIRSGAGDNIRLFAFQGVAISNQKAIARIAFNLEELNEKYKSWMRRVKDPSINSGREIDILVSYYDRVLRYDPGLPSDLLPDNWPFIKTWSIFIGLMRKKGLTPKQTRGKKIGI